MDYRIYGNTGTKISSITFGAQTFGWNCNEEESFQLADLYVSRGGNYIDTADSYNQGEAERIVGKWLKKRNNREQLLLGTKVFFPTGKGVNDTGLSRKHIYQSIDKSLKRLNTDYIDIYQLHCWDGMTPIEEILQTLNDLVRQGKVRYIGASNFTPAQLMKSVMISRQNSWAAFSSLQLEYSMLVRSPEWELIPVCDELMIGTMAWSPLAGGWLTGKYQRSKAAPINSRVGRGDRWDDGEEQRASERTWLLIDEMTDISKELEKPVSQVTLNWMRQKQRVVTSLIGARTIEQLTDNLDCLSWKLCDEHLERLDKVSQVDTPYPYSFIDNYTRHPDT